MTEETISAIFALGPQVRYLAAARGQDVEPDADPVAIAEAVVRIVE